ncbi:hypothetical protein TNCV_3150941, partial [Trichonephila clavipes]
MQAKDNNRRKNPALRLDEFRGFRFDVTVSI